MRYGKLVRRAEAAADREVRAYYAVSCRMGSPLSNAQYDAARAVFVAYWMAQLESRARTMEDKRALFLARELATNA